MIILITGATRIGSRLLRPSDGPFAADPETEARLVRAGAARYCGGEAVITDDTEPEDAGPGIDPAEPETAEESGEGADTACYTESGLMLMTNRELETILSGLGLERPRRATKAALVGLIMDRCGVEGEAPPELGAEAPEI